MLDGDIFISHSVDKCNKESRYMELPTEIYNKITPTGLPPHELRLKKVSWLLGVSLHTIDALGSLRWTFSLTVVIDIFTGLRGHVAAESQRQQGAVQRHETTSEEVERTRELTVIVKLYSNKKILL